jgi:hypothetical protein
MQSIRDDEPSSAPTTSSVAAKDQMEEEDTFVPEHLNDPIPDPETSFRSNTNVPNTTPAPATPSTGGLTEEQRKLIEAKRQEVRNSTK